MTLDYSFSTADLTFMREVQDGHMLDTGNVQPVSVSTDSFGQSVESYPTNSASITCGLDCGIRRNREGADCHNG